MATFRVGVGSFNIKDGAVGFGTDTDGLGNLKVKGVTKTTGSIVSGASTLTRYSGFAADNINQLENITLTSEVGTIGDIVVGVGTSVIISSASTVTVGTVESVSIGTHFSPPVGGVEERGDNFIEGMMRFNTDLNTMEFYNGNEWRQFTYISDIQNSPGSAGRGVIRPSPSPTGGETPNANITTFSVINGGTNTEYGTLSAGAYAQGGSFSSSIRIVMSGGTTYTGPYAVVNNMDYKAIASAGDTQDFGDLTSARRAQASLSSSTRGLTIGGVNPGSLNIIDYVETATLGDALDFGDCITAGRHQESGCSSPTRGLFVHGNPSNINHIDTVQIASKGNSIEFGQRMFNGGYTTGNCNGVRALFGGGYQQSPIAGANRGQITMVTVASMGNETQFGDLNVARYQSWGLTSKTRACFLGGVPTAPVSGHEIDSVFYESAGKSVSFGELDRFRWSTNGATDCHGGLGGY